MISAPDELTPDWPAQIFEALHEADIRQVTYVPDAGHAKLIDLCLGDNRIDTTALTNEMEGVGMACGAWLGGQRSVLLMQSSGAGNCINAMSALAACRFPFLTLVSMRGEFGENNGWQVPMGQATRPALEAIGLLVYAVNRPEDVRRTIDAALDISFTAGERVAVLLSQELIGAKKFGPAT